jgi:TonB family protein
MRRHVLTLVLAAAATSLGSAAPSAQNRVTRVAEEVLRTNVLTSVMPAFPERALSRGSRGVAVAAVVIDSGGAVDSVQILEAPDPDIAAAVSSALYQWRFKSVDDLTKQFTGKLTFYFLVRDGRPEVLNPQETPYIGRWSRKTLPRKAAKH